MCTDLNNFSRLQSMMNCGGSCFKTYHLALNMKLHYLAIFQPYLYVQIHTFYSRYSIQKWSKIYY